MDPSPTAQPDPARDAPPEPAQADKHREAVRLRRATGGIDRLVRTYFLVVFKNVIGWLCILASPILGVLLPGPGGIPLALIGFALVTFPGKRRLTTHVFRGRRLPIESPLFTGLITFLSVAVTGSLMYLSWRYYERIVGWLPTPLGMNDLPKLLAISLLALPVTMVTLWLSLRLLNGALRWVPKIRRLLRRMLRKWGIHLLPARRRRIGGRTEFVTDEIIGLDDQQRRRLRRVRFWAVPWMKRLALVAFTVGVVYLVVAPVIREWSEVERKIGRIEAWRLAAGVGLYGVGLLMFRAVAWRHVLTIYGHRLPAKAAARIWSLGYLARLIPGQAYQILRMELTRRYGPTGVQANSAQRLESVTTGIAGVAIGIGAFIWFGDIRVPALHWLWVALAVLLAGALFVGVPMTFYRIAPEGSVLGRRGGRVIGRTRVPRRSLAALLMWSTAGVIVLGYASYLVVGRPIGGSGVWHAIIGAYALAMASSAFTPWAPGGLGVRELVFVGLVSVLLPSEFKQSFASEPVPVFDVLEPRSWQNVWWAFLFFLALVLRLATTTAEVLVATATTAVDWREMLAIAKDEMRPSRTPFGGAVRVEPKNTSLDA